MTMFTRTDSARRTYVRGLTNAIKRDLKIVEPELAAATDEEIWQKIRRDPVIAHAINMRRHLVAGREWQMTPASDSQADKLAAQIMEEVIDCCQSFAASRYNLAEAVIRGNSWLFIQGRRKMQAIAGTLPQRWWVPTSMPHVDKYRFQLRREGIEAARWHLWSVERENWEELGDRRKWFVRHCYDNTEETLGYGRGLLESLWVFHSIKTKVMEYMADGVETWARGIIVASIDTIDRPGSTTRQPDDIQSEWVNVLQQLRSRHVLVHGKEDDVKVIQGGGEGWQMGSQFISYLDNSMRTLVLGANLPTSATEGGSFALAKVQENSTEALVQYDRCLLEESLTRDLVALVWRLNRPQLAQIGLQAARMPRLKIRQEKREDPAVAANVAATLLSAGVPLREDEVYDKTGYSVPGPDEKLIKPRPTPAPFPGLGLGQ